MITYEHQLTAYLWRRENRAHAATGKAPIYLRIEVPGFDRAELSTGVQATAAEWHAPTQRLRVQKGADELAQHCVKRDNQTLSKWLLRVDQTYTAYKVQGGNPSPMELREVLRGKRSPDDNEARLLTVGERFLEELAQPGKKRRPNTLRSVRQALDKLTLYCQHIRKAGVLAQDINRAWCRTYERWCMGQGWQADTVRWYVSVLRRVVGFAADEGLIETSLVERYVYLSESERKAKRHLTTEELAHLEARRFGKENVQRVADLFLFCCYTGLSFVDYTRFAQAPHTFLQCEEGVLGICMQRQKMLRKDKSFWVPLFPKAAELLAQYDYQLPTYVSSFVSRTLKLVAQELTAQGFHLQDLKHKDARSTFSQLMRDKFGGELAAGMAGHSQEVMNSNYSSTSPKRIVEQLTVLGAVLTHN